MSATAVVTGGSDGIGYAIAERFVEAGTDVIIVARDEEKLFRAADSLGRHGGKVTTVVVDLSSATAVDVIADRVRHTTDTVDVLINNVGVAHFSTLADATDADVEAMLQLNIKVPFALTRALLPPLMAARGAVVNISSYWARKMVVGRPSAAYSASRAAIEGMTRALANELGPNGIRVNAVAPGAVLTPTYQNTYLAAMSDQQRQEHEHHVTAAYPLGRLGRPQDVAAAAYFLGSPEASWITGVVLPVDGGLTIR
jgi:NAD(P)-dependent dehydrogenase (short-subunit alcohol dehydrogenase family)